MGNYQVIADELAAEINAGRLRPGQRLPPQRRFARQHGIASSTASRVYAELVRRGLVTGEVGRGTFVRAGTAAPEPALAEPATARVDLELNVPVLADQGAVLAAGLARMTRPDVLANGLRPIGAAGTEAARRATAALLARAGWAPDPRHVLFAGNGRQAIAAALAAVVPAGERLGVERFTYPVVRSIAARLGIRLVPLDMDEHGVLPQAVTEASPLRAVYLQPAVHNPLGTTMPEHRRAVLARVLREADLCAIEDSVYGFLRTDLPPLAAHAPERTILVDSLSKRVAPGLTLGFLVAPPAMVPSVASALRSGGWAATRFPLEVATGWMTEGTVTSLSRAKFLDATERQRIAAAQLAGFTVRADPHGYHCWWELPPPWRADTFVAAAARHGVAVTPAAAFTVDPGHAPGAVRLALGSPGHDVLAEALGTLAALARTSPEDVVTE